MARLVLASVLAAAEAGTLAITYQDCGAQHAQVTDLQPTTIHTGKTETISGTGTSDEDVTSAHFTATLSALGTQLSECSGDGTKDIVCNLPLGLGKITVKALTFPIAKGTVTIPVEVKTSFLIPASLAKVDVHIAAEDQNGESVICLDVHTEKAGPTAPTPTPPSPTPDYYQTIKPRPGSHRDPNLCLDAPGGDASNGNRVWLFECNGAESQRWRFDNWQIRYAPDESKCIDAGNMSDATQLFLLDCNGEPQQTWGYDGDQSTLYLLDLSIPRRLGHCLDGYMSGLPLHVWQCDGDWNQEWSIWDSPTLSVV